MLDDTIVRHMYRCWSGSRNWSNCRWDHYGYLARMARRLLFRYSKGHVLLFENTPNVLEHAVLEHLLQADLPNLQTILIASWEWSTFHRFIETHGHKLRHVDFCHDSAQVFRNAGCLQAGEERPDSIEEMLRCCVSLESLTLRSLSGLLALLDTQTGHRNLHTIHLSTSSAESLWRIPESEARPQSWPFFPVDSTYRVSELFEREGWENKLSALRKITVYNSTPLQISMRDEVKPS